MVGTLAFVGVLAGCGASSSGNLFPSDGADGGAQSDPTPPGQPGSTSGGGISGGGGSSSDGGAAEDAHWTAETDASSGNADGGSPSSDAGLLGCGAVNACGAPKTLGTVRGDVGNDTLQLKGMSSEFVKLTVSEADGNLTPVGLSFTVTLSSPSSADFDLYVYQPGCDDSTMYGRSTTAGAGSFERVWAGWPDSLGPDDTREVIIEVRYNAASGGTCGVHSWSLAVEGNTTAHDD